MKVKIEIANLLIINMFAPLQDKSEEGKGQFHEKLAEACDKI